MRYFRHLLECTGSLRPSAGGRRVPGAALAVLVFTALAAAIAAPDARAQAYPSRPVKLLVPYPAGSGPDQLARILADGLQAHLKQGVVVDNRSGALGVIGTMEVARSAPDGYTLLMTTNTTQAANVALVKDLRYDPVKDFAPVTRIATGPMILMVRADFPAANVSELVRAAQGGLSIKVGYGSAASQVAAAKIVTAARLDVVNAPYKGIPLAVTDLLGGHISLTFADLPVAIPMVRAGRAKALGVTSLKRLAGEPNIPALAETFPGFEVIGWQGVVAPAGTPEAVVRQLDEALQRVIVAPATAERIRGIHYTVAPLGPKGFSEYITKEIARWKEDAKLAGIEPQ